MLSRILSRLLQAIPVLILIGVVVFLLVRLLPGDPAAVLLGDRATPESLARVRAQFGFDKPLPVQALLFFGRLLHGDLGMSVTRRVPVVQLVAERLPITLYLTGLAALLAVVLAVPLAAVAALRQDRAPDIVIRGTFQVGLSMPIFYIGLVLLGFLGVRLHWFPVGGVGEGFWDGLYHLILPALTLALSLAAVLMRNLRAAIILVLRAEYVDFARAKGLSPRIIMNRHVLRNALISTVALFGLNVGTLLGGAVITENVFALPGVGALMVESIFGRDYPVVQGLTLVLAVLVSLTFLATDLVEAWLDPRGRA